MHSTPTLSKADFGIEPRRSRRQFLAATAVCLGVPSLSGWAQPTLIDVKVTVPGPGNSVSLPLELAVKIGADRAEGLNLRLKFVGGGAIVFSDLQAGDADFAVVGMPAAMFANLSQPTLIALAALEDLSLYSLMVREDLRGKVRRIADLKGRVIGIHGNAVITKTTSNQVFELILRVNGIAPDEVRYIAAGQTWETQSAALISGTVDATFPIEPLGQRLATEKLAFRLFSTGDPKDVAQTPGAGFLRGTLIARRDKVAANADVAERMVRMTRRVLAWLDSRKAEEVADRMAITGSERRAFIEVWQQFPRQYSRDGKFSTAQLQETDIFFKASNSDNAAAQRFTAESMVMDKWSGRKP